MFTTYRPNMVVSLQGMVRASCHNSWLLQYEAAIPFLVPKHQPEIVATRCKLANKYQQAFKKKHILYDLTMDAGKMFETSGFDKLFQKRRGNKAGLETNFSAC